MISRTITRPLTARLSALSQVMHGVADTLHAQNSLLRQRGLALAPHLLSGLDEITGDLQRMADFLQPVYVELEQLEALAQTTALVNSSLDLDRVLNEVMDTVIQLTGAERGYIVLRNEDTGALEFRVARNLDRETLDRTEFIVSRTVVNNVAVSGRPVLTTNAQSDPAYSTQESVVLHALRSILCVPLLVKDQVTGVVYVDNRVKDGVFREKELSLLTAFANQAAVAIENARLFAHMQTALSEITAMKELMDNVFASIASGVLTLDTAGTILTCNEAAARIFGVPGAAIQGFPVAEIMPSLAAALANPIATVLNGGRYDWLDLTLTLPERGEVYLQLTLSPLRNEQRTEGAVVVVNDLTEIRQREATLEVVRRYLPPGMVDHIQSLDSLGLGGERRIITILFVEVRPFHSFPASLSPQELMEQLNLYLTVGAEAIHSCKGVIDKFMGNEIMGLFNTQLNPSDDHAWQAILAALAMADEFQALTERLDDEPVAYWRIGIHTGMATLGNVGSPLRRAFTAIGDTVNLAKRLQENAAPGQIILSEETYCLCSGPLNDPSHSLLVRERGSLRVRGRSQATAIYELCRHRPS
ncbi:MAG: GAF domain-containing protein [Aggregatilineaceae bacterium]